MSTAIEKTCKTCGRTYRTAEDFLTGTRRWRLCDLQNLWFNCTCGSTLMLTRGKYPWYSPEHSMGAEARAVFNQLGNLKDLPHLPTAVMKLQILIADPETEPKELALAVRREPFVAASVLQVADNLCCTRDPDNAPIRSLEHAIVYIGRKALSDIVLTAAIRSFEISPSVLDTDAFWEEAFVTAAIAEALNERFATGFNRDEVYVAGSLANVGKLVTAICFPAIATQISKDVKDRKLQSSWRQAELAYKFPEHTILGEIAASMWGLPVYVAEAARRHHELPTAKIDLPTLIGFAQQLSHWVLLQPHRIEPDLLDGCKTRFDLEERALDKLAEEFLAIRQRLNTGRVAYC